MPEDRNEDCLDLSMRSPVIMRSLEPKNGQGGPIVRQAETDEQLVQLWLHGRSMHTQRAYRREADRFIDFLRKPLMSARLIDVQAFTDHLAESLKVSSVHRATAAVKSLLTFGFRLGYLPFDVGLALKTPAFRDELTERILGETDVLRIISLEPNRRNRALMLTLYAGGFRVSEVCSLKWRHLQGRNSAGQITVFGKGGKTRTVLMPQAVWETIRSLQNDDSPESPVFRSRKRGHLDESAVWRIVNKSAERAGIDKNVSAHWFRHAHASHALDRGCPIHLVQATLGHSSISTTGRYLHARPTDASGNYLLVAATA